ncbi:hypothetical protein JQK88_29820 [Mesorhizobium caraganae]|uniref:PIN-like domain-containing protein n=1 Tax=Mesorhizobium caraganae TaxID=483206 RepID=UPI001785A13D|nr:hypothetical protein [Mesorhizobium caraganae]MBM2715332.1 hypothetical protein [Mesorhizobium caraganae]
MKIKFDANVSPKIVRALRALENDSSIELGSVHEDYQAGIADPDWMFKFAAEGGVAMISGDHNILQKPENLIAYIESGLISIWPSHGWPELKRFGKAALTIRWWITTKQRILTSQKGDGWRLPMGWTPGVEKFTAIKDPRVDG